MQITVQYVGDMLCEACSRHSGDTTRFVRKDLSFVTVRRATVFEPTRKTSVLCGPLRRTLALVFAPSDSATSCLMISPFCLFSAFLCPLAHVFVKIANSSSAVITAINTMPIITRFSTTCVVRAVVEAGILHLLALRDVGYRSCCPDPPLLAP